MVSQCLAVKNVYRVVSHGHAKRIPPRERCPVLADVVRCPNRWTVLVEFVTDPPTGAKFCDEHWERAKIDGPCQ
jgi:hypothetical protein